MVTPEQMANAEASINCASAAKRQTLELSNVLSCDSSIPLQEPTPESPAPQHSVGRRPLKRSLVSVYDKTGLAELGRALVAAGVEIVSTGSTAKVLTAAGVPVTEVEQLTGFPECLGGRVKTLHPKIHAGILADLRLTSHAAQLADLNIAPFDLVVSNLYPFSATVATGATPDECVEQIDIGGPAMVRAAAKNYPSVAVITSPERYDEVYAALAADGFSYRQRQELAAAAFAHTAAYDAAVATWMNEVLRPDGFPDYFGTGYTLPQVLRYGENAHQSAALYVDESAPLGLAQAKLLHGKEMSYNNYTDGDAAYRTVYDFERPCVAIIKHANPCGIAVADTIAAAHALAHACDPVSAFGSVVAANREISLEMATALKEIFTEVIIAPGYEPAALELLQSKKGLRILVAPAYSPRTHDVRQISGGALLLSPDRIDAPGDEMSNWQLVAGSAADTATCADLGFAWRACRAVKSNAILLASGGASVGVGMGQVNRVDSCRLAVTRAGIRAAGSVAASDAFFPFADGVAVLIAAGVKAIVEPGGSIRDQDTIDACAKADVSLYFTGVRHFFH
ncbi:MAG: bifunctional phosphoribosylaminoimidazolecarboxamide formyltransferase/IMP cyclohydrolase [Propionibacteriaceae bacterium]|nr:bifunctional phosphoribosylaminoimidazolecarboxamide formyltransferase/IMP cyclohydrolase [Propionibacteriaceae bacterium]